MMMMIIMEKYSNMVMKILSSRTDGYFKDYVSKSRNSYTPKREILLLPGSCPKDSVVKSTEIRTEIESILFQALLL